MKNHVKTRPREPLEKYQTSLVIRFALYALLGYVIIFTIARIANFHLIAELRALNYIVYFIVAFLGVQKFKEASNNEMSYLQGFMTGLFIAKVSFALYAIVMYVYLKFFDRVFLQYLVDYAPFGISLTPLSAAVLLFIEGQAIGIASSLILMQYFKKNINKITKTI
jgi:hypothetical protein